MEYNREPFYKPSEDSYLLSRYVGRLVEGRVLDMGTGSGIQAVTAAMKVNVTHVVASDINPLAIEAARKCASEAGMLEKISFVLSDLFENLPGEFNWIIFNPPYLQSERELSDRTWDGGLKGVEVIERFLEVAREHLSPLGSILLIYSSETCLKPEKYSYRWDILESVPLFFEKLYCARLSPF